MGWANSVVRKRPKALKFSRARPGGSIRIWQEAHRGLSRCKARASRWGGGRSAGLVIVSSRGGTLGGGGEGGEPRMFSRIHLPRLTGDVRVGLEVTVRTLPMVITPPRGSLGGR